MSTPSVHSSLRAGSGWRSLKAGNPVILLLIALLVLILNWVNTTGEYILGSTVTAAAKAAVAAGTTDALSESEFIGLIAGQQELRLGLLRRGHRGGC